MDHRVPLELHTVLPLGGISCHIEGVIGQGANAIVYKGWYWDGLNQNAAHHVLVKELFPYHPQKKIWRNGEGQIVVEAEATEMWNLHKDSFIAGNEVHLRLLADHPELMTMGVNFNSFRYNGTLYSLLGYTGGRSLQAELNGPGVSLRRVARRMIGILDGLEAFHKSGYLHLDISPDNIMLVGQEKQERIFLIDYNSVRRVDARSSGGLSCKTGYSAPEVSTGNLSSIGFPSDLYSVAAVFYRCLMGRSLTLAESLRAKAPDGQDSPMLAGVPQTVSSMVGTILKKGLHTLPKRRYQSIGQMRQAFQELIDRIDCVGVTHWSLWENGKRSVEELIRRNPSLRYLEAENGLYPIRLMRQEESMSLTDYLAYVLSPEGKSGIIVAQGGMGKTTLLLHTALLQGKRYAPTAPAIFYISLNGWNGADTQYIRRQILMRLRFKPTENTFDSAMHALHQLLGQRIPTKNGEGPMILLLLDGLNELRGDTGPLMQEITELNAMAGVRMIAASRSGIPQLELQPVELMPLSAEDVEGALGANGQLLPEGQEVLQLLRTPLILSIYIQTGNSEKQLAIQSEEELLQAYLDALLEKELRKLPENSPQRWQVDAALNYVLPAIAAQVKRSNAPLTERQILSVVAMCWKQLNSPAVTKTFPRWIGHSADIKGNAETAEAWYGIVIHGLLWQQLGMLMQDETGRYRIFHQVVEDYLADRKVPIIDRKRRVGLFGIGLLCVALLVSYQLYCREQIRMEQEQQAYLRQLETDEKMKDAFELAASGYVEYGKLYRQLRTLTDLALTDETEEFQAIYSDVLAEVEEEQKKLPSEETERQWISSNSMYDQMAVSWSDDTYVYEHGLLCALVQYADERAGAYGDVLPVLKVWVESDRLRGKVPDFAQAFSQLLEADANLAAEMYHQAVGVHLSDAAGDWQINVNALIALIPELDAHRDTTNRDNRGQLMRARNTAFLKAEQDFKQEFSKANAYIRNGA